MNMLLANVVCLHPIALDGLFNEPEEYLLAFVTILVMTAKYNEFHITLC